MTGPNRLHTTIMGSLKPSNTVRAKVTGQSSFKRRLNDTLAKVIGKASIKRRSTTTVARAVEKTSDKKRTKTALAKVVEPTKIEIIPTQQSRYARYPSGLPDPLPGTNPLRNDPVFSVA